MKRKSTFTDSQKLAYDIVDGIIDSEYTGEYNPTDAQKYQARNHSVHTPIANYVFEVKKNVREEERWESIVKLARSLNDSEFQKTIKVLGYSITSEDDKIFESPAFKQASKLADNIKYKKEGEDTSLYFLEILKLTPQLDDEERTKIFEKIEDKPL